MRIFTLSAIITLIAIISFAATRQLQAKPDTTVPLSQHYSIENELPNSNYVAIYERNATRNFSGTIVLYNNLALKSMKAGSLKTAESMLLKHAVPLSSRYGTDRSDYDCFMALADTYMRQKKYSQAKWFYIQSNTSARKSRYSRGEVLSLIKLAQVKKTIGDHTLALQDLKQAEKIAIKNNFKSSLPEIRKSIKGYSKKGHAVAKT